MAGRLSIREYSHKDVEDLVRLFNTHMTHLPYVWPITVEEFRHGLIETAEPRGHELPFDPNGLKIACREGKPVAYAHAVQLPQLKQGQAMFSGAGAIYFFCVGRGDLEATQALISACSDYLSQRGGKLSLAWPVAYTYWFLQGGKGYVPEDSHLAEVLLGCGWNPTVREHIMALELYPPGELVTPRIEIEVRRVRLSNRFRERGVEAWLGERRIGQVYWRKMSQMNRHPEAARVCYVGSVETNPEFRRMGIGSCLMTQAAHDMRKEGQAHAWLYTLVTNQAGIGLYTSVGWRSRGVAACYAPPGSGQS